MSNALRPPEDRVADGLMPTQGQQPQVDFDQATVDSIMATSDVFLSQLAPVPLDPSSNLGHLLKTQLTLPSVQGSTDTGQYHAYQVPLSSQDPDVSRIPLASALDDDDFFRNLNESGDWSLGDHSTAHSTNALPLPPQGSENEAPDLATSVPPERSLPSKEQGATGASEAIPATSTGQVPQTKKFQRRQNHSCDQCRAAKRACGLRVPKGKPIQVPCDACALRGTTCTTNWLQRKLGPTLGVVTALPSEKYQETLSDDASPQHQFRTQEAAPTKRKRQSSQEPNLVQGSIVKVESPISAAATAQDRFLLQQLGLASPTGKSQKLAESQLSNGLVSRSFCVFLSAWEVPMGEWLGQGCSPFEGGLECVRRTMNDDFVAWASRLGMDGPAKSFVHSFASELPREGFQPEHLYASLFLDSALSWLRRSTKSPSDVSPQDVKRARRTTAQVEQALMWAMVAHSTQFHDAAEEQLPLSRSTRPLRQQVASTAWRKARNAIYSLASVDSFALCSAMLIFGLTIRPSDSDGFANDATSPEDDTAFCLREGSVRFQRLVNKLNNGLSNVLDEDDFTTQSGPSSSSTLSRAEAKAFLLGLSNACKWLGVMVTAVAPLADPNADVLGGLRANEILVVPSQSPNGAAFTTVPHLYQTPAMPPTPAPSDSVWDKISKRSSSAQGLQKTLVPLLHSRKHSVELFQYFLRAGSSYKVLMFRAAAEVDEVCRRWLGRPIDARNSAALCAAVELALHVVDTWDKCFGAIEAAAIEVIPKLSPSHRTMLTYLSGHANHAILTVLDLLATVDDQLVSMSANPSFGGLHFGPLGSLTTRLAQSRQIRRTRRLHSARLILKGATHRNSLIYQQNVQEGQRSGDSTPPTRLSTPFDKPLRHLALSSATTYIPAADGLIDSRPLGTWCHPYPALAVRVQAHATATLYTEYKECCILESSLGHIAAANVGLTHQKQEIETNLIESMNNLQEIRDSLVFNVDYLIKEFDLPQRNVRAR